jgi:hypothetical protein
VVLVYRAKALLALEVQPKERRGLALFGGLTKAALAVMELTQIIYKPSLTVVLGYLDGGLVEIMVARQAEIQAPTHRLDGAVELVLFALSGPGPLGNFHQQILLMFNKE